MSYMRCYIEKLETPIPESKAANLEARTIAAVKKFVDNFYDYEFYTGESMRHDDMVALLTFREDGMPYFIFWKHGLKEHRL